MFIFFNSKLKWTDNYNEDFTKINMGSSLLNRAEEYYNNLFSNYPLNNDILLINDKTYYNQIELDKNVDNSSYIAQYPHFYYDDQ